MPQTFDPIEPVGAKPEDPTSVLCSWTMPPRTSRRLTLPPVFDVTGRRQSVLARIRQLMAQQSPQARREVELNVPVVVSQVERFRYRWEIWDSRVEAHESEGVTS